MRAVAAAAALFHGGKKAQLRAAYPCAMGGCCRLQDTNPSMTDQPSILKADDQPPSLEPQPTTRPGLIDPGLAYDYYKSMVSLSVATLGGILTLGGTVFGARLAPWQMLLSAMPVALSGLLALQGKTDIVQLRESLKPLRNTSKLGLKLVPSLYGAGLGLFLGCLLLSILKH
jgi:hypothetical protein